MNCLLLVCSYGPAIFRRAGHFIARNRLNEFCASSWNRNFECTGIRTADLEFLLTRFHVKCYSSRSSKGKASRSRELNPGLVMEQEKDAFFVVRKGGVVGVYKSLADCQAQVGSLVCDPPISVYKGYSLTKDTGKYFNSCGLKNALYTITAADLKEDLFGTLVPCPIQDPATFKGKSSSKNKSKKRSGDMLELETGEALDSISTADPLRKHAKLCNHAEVQAASSNQVFGFDVKYLMDAFKEEVILSSLLLHMLFAILFASVVAAKGCKWSGAALFLFSSLFLAIIFFLFNG
ncbi:hypothetical protein SLA2020_108760 [Shorea laevis]